VEDAFPVYARLVRRRANDPPEPLTEWWEDEVSGMAAVPNQVIERLAGIRTFHGNEINSKWSVGLCLYLFKQAILEVKPGKTIYISATT
jgi:hypothetical protein